MYFFLSWLRISLIIIFNQSDSEFLYWNINPDFFCFSLFQIHYMPFQFFCFGIVPRNCFVYFGFFSLSVLVTVLEFLLIFEAGVKRMFILLVQTILYTHIFRPLQKFCIHSFYKRKHIFVDKYLFCFSFLTKIYSLSAYSQAYCTGSSERLNTLYSIVAVEMTWIFLNAFKQSSNKER